MALPPSPYCSAVIRADLCKMGEAFSRVAVRLIPL